MNNEVPKISVIIPVYNGEKTISLCIQAVFNSTLKNIEIIVIDDGSTDNTLNIICKLPVRYFSQSNNGPASARNLGVKFAISDILFFLDADVILEPDALLIAYESFINPEVNIVNGIYHKLPANPSFITEYKALFEYYFFRITSIKEEYAVFMGRCAGIRKAAFEKVGGYNTKFTTASVEQEELGFRLSKYYKFKLEPRVNGKHFLPSWEKLIKSYFIRTRDWIELFFIKKKFDSTMTTKSMSISTITGALFLLSLPIIFFYPFVFCFSIFFLTVFFYGYFDIFIFMYKEKGCFFCLKSILTALILSFVLSIASCYGLLIKVMKYGK